MKTLLILLPTLIISSFLPRQAGATVYHSNGSAANVQNIHNNLAHDGDTITIPAGTFIWSVQVRITKAITLTGQGIATDIGDNVPKDNNCGDASVLIKCEFGPNGYPRITNFKIHGIAQDTNNCNRGTISVDGNNHNVRIDHITIYHPGSQAMLIGGDTWGVADHNYMDCSNFKGGIDVVHPNWGGGTNGDLSWEQPVHWGSREFFFMEDNTYIGNGEGGAAGFGGDTMGARIVVRKNTLINANMGNHGTEASRYRSIRAYEIYNNTARCTISLLNRFFHPRGGTGVVWGNSATGNPATRTGYQNFIMPAVYRATNHWTEWGDWPSVWDGPGGHPALDQVGSGMCLDQIRRQPPINQRTGNAAWPRNQSEPLYVWNNNWQQVPNNHGVLVGGDDGRIQVGRDVKLQPMPGYTPYVYPHPLVTTGSRATVSDFNADSHPDYVLQKPYTRQTAVWYLNNNVYVSSAYGPTLAAGWGLRAVADFNLGSNSDYGLFALSTHQTAIWYLSGPTLIGSAYGPSLPNGWELVGSTDFNGDNKPDYVLYNASTRQTAVWYMNNNAFTGGAFGPTLPAGWSLAGVADFNRDGKTDYLLFNATTRQSAIWYLAGVTFVGGVYGPTLPSGWALVATADFNGDGAPDYLLYNASTRQTAIWYMNNNVFAGGVYGPTLPVGWTLVGQ